MTFLCRFEMVTQSSIIEYASLMKGVFLLPEEPRFGRYKNWLTTTVVMLMGCVLTSGNHAFRYSFLAFKTWSTDKRSNIMIYSWMIFWICLFFYYRIISHLWALYSGTSKDESLLKLVLLYLFNYLFWNHSQSPFFPPGPMFRWKKWTLTSK